MRSLAWLILMALTSCGKPKNLSELNRIIGDNELQPVVLEQYDPMLVKAIGRVRVGCTVTHIGGGLGLTAGHCFTSKYLDGMQKNLKCNLERYQVVWGLVAGNQSPKSARCKEIKALEYNEIRDYALIQIEPFPQEYVELNFALPNLGEIISIYSHPRKRPLEWSNYCSVEHIYSHPRQGLLSYSCDTELGSSGAPLINHAGHMIGIHSFYDDELDRNGGMPIAMLPLLSDIL